jgi:hypothetical protein
MSLFELFTMPVDQMFQGFFLPFLIIFVIIWAILNSLRVFDRKVNMVLSLSVSILSSSTPQFTMFARYITQMGAQVAIVAFGLVFGLGVLMWSLGRSRDIYYEHLGLNKKRLRKEKQKLYREYRRVTNKSKRREIMERIKEIDLKIALAD